ncbi:hypothetical protein BDA96_08G147100 [Sorghum bicolor]|uniref:diaminopimelate epimerase n=1 Tax=Sorghum bicolor TaxID=4558 RepID=A0A921QFX6_SORBI|nr:hypothetical protein BDA96_08G147100 [Sorghum bicolor]
MSPAAATAFSAASVATPRGRVSIPLRGVPAAPRRVVASMAVSAPRSGVATSFLERRESERALHYQVSAPRSGAAAAASFVERRESERALHFVKYQGLGNDFILVDNRDSWVPKVTPEEAVKLCDRNFGIGADGVIFVMPGVNGADYNIKIFNSDGSEPEMCGNGVRCFARFIAEIENLQGTNSFTIHTGAGKIIPEMQSDGQVKVDMDEHIPSGPDIPTKLLATKNKAVVQAKLVVEGLPWHVTCVSMGVTFGAKEVKVKVDMGEPILSGPGIPTKLLATKNKAAVQAELAVEGLTWHVTCVSMGNPHCVTFGAKELKVDDLKFSKIGPKFERHEMFPARTNTESVQDSSCSHLNMRVCGHGAVIIAAVVIMVTLACRVMSGLKKKASGRKKAMLSFFFFFDL